MSSNDPSRHPDDETCRAFRPVIEFAGRRWVALILLAAARGARRPVEYYPLVPGITPRLLTQRFREMEAVGIIRREVVPSTPVQVSYLPTERGMSLLQALRPLVHWSVQQSGDVFSPATDSPQGSAS